MIFTLGKRYEYPYRLLYDRKVWPDYEGILKHLPENHLYVANSVGLHLGPSRSSFSLVARNIDRLPWASQLFWNGVRERLHDPALCEHLAVRLGVRKRPLYPFATLCRDRKGHFIDVHPDWDRKVMTVQFYLPPDESMKELGTDIYDKDKRWIRRLEFLPNTAYCFARSETSYHGLREIKRDVVRDTLMLTYYGEPFDEY